MCNLHSDDLSSLMKWEWSHSLSWIGCDSEFEADRELTLPVVPRAVDDLSNRFRRVCRQLGSAASWPAAIQEGPGTVRITISAATRAARANARAHAESVMCDRNIVNLSYNRSLKVLTRHRIVHVNDIVLPDGRWLPFKDLPKTAQRDTAWSHLDFEALCELISRSLPQSERARATQTDDQPQLSQDLQRSGANAVPRHKPTAHSAHADKFRYLHSVVKQDGDSYLCQFTPPFHKWAHLPPLEWKDAWQLGAYLCQGASTFRGKVQDSRWTTMTCHSVKKNTDGVPELWVTSDIHPQPVPIPIFGELVHLLTTRPMSEQAVCPEEWLRESQCTIAQWNSFKRARELFYSSQRIQEATPEGAAPRVPMSASHLDELDDQKTLHAFHADNWQPDPDVNSDCFRPVYRPSQENWAFAQRHADSRLTFDTTSMDMRTVCLSQGAWCARSRHGQSIIEQWPRQYRKNNNALTFSKTYAVMDIAQLRPLLEQGATLLQIADAIARQPAQDLKSEGWSRSFTTQARFGGEFTTLWGTTALTWDPSYANFVSPCSEDVSLGSLDFDTALSSAAHRSLIFLDLFSTAQQERILEVLADTEDGTWMLITSQSRSRSSVRNKLEAAGRKHDHLLTGRRLASKTGADPSWRTGDVTPSPLTSSYDVWIAPDCVVPEAEWDGWLAHAPLPGSYHSRLSQVATDYWEARQDGAYLQADGILTACDGSAGGDMGARVVWQDQDGEFTSEACKVFGPPSSFRAEAAAMHLAVDGAPRDLPLTVLTDSMNVLYALRAFNTSEFDRGMRHQRNADIIRDILMAINLRTAPTHLVKVKSHRGILLNEMADEVAGSAQAAAAEAVDTRYYDYVPDSDGIFFTWVDEDGEIVTTAETNTVVKRWHATQDVRTVKGVREAATFGGQFLTDADAGRHLLQLSKHHRPWSAMEERRWMQQVGHVLPLNGYLHRINRHPTGFCPWCPGIRESQMHFQCQCKEFEENRTAAHHNIAKAVISELREQKPSGWTFWYETSLTSLPWQFAWASPLEARKQRDRRPDGVAFHAATKHVVFLEVSRPMDQQDNMAKASERKGMQYSEAMDALRRAQRRRGTQGETSVVSTLPILVGVRGSVEYSEAVNEFNVFKLSKRKLDKVLAAGVRAAITAASDMISARAAALPFAHMRRARRRRRRPHAAA